MFAPQIVPPLVLQRRPDRRADDRVTHGKPVEINGLPATGRDISANGISVVTGAPVAVGDVVRVTLLGPVDARGSRTRTARVARVDRRAERFLIGLEFLY